MINATYLEDKTPAEIVDLVDGYMPKDNPGNYALTVYNAAVLLIEHFKKNKPCSEYILNSTFLTSFIFDYHTVVVFRKEYPNKIIHFAVNIPENRVSEITWDIRVS